MSELWNIPGSPRARRRERSSPRLRAPGHPLRIDAFAVAACQDAACELPLFLESLLFHHPRARVYVLTDRAGLRAIDSLELPDSVQVETISDRQIEALASQVTCRDHGERWSIRFIAVKLEAFRRAVERYRCGVMLCDADLLFTGPLPEISWDADLVLSTHHGPCWPPKQPKHHGHYNAGMALTARLDIVERWIRLYRQGLSLFYEQQCLERLATEYVTDLFPAAWNWGGWRHAEDIEQSGRDPLILHSHIVGKWKDQGRGRIRAVKTRAREHLDRIRRSRETWPRWAFVHCAKAAGSSFSTMIHRHVARERGYQYLDSHTLGLQRDWRPAELDLIREGSLWGQTGDRWIVHNHAQNWYREPVEKMSRDGWRFLSLYRPVRDRLVSFWFWSLRVIGERGESWMRPPITEARHIDTFLEILLDHPLYETEWALPEFSELIDHWYPASDDGMTRACRELWDVDVPAALVNGSASPGWAGCIDQGLISPALVDRVESDPRVRAWDRFARDRGLDL